MGEGSYITLFSPSDLTAFHRMKYGGGGCYITLFSPSDVTAFHIIHLNTFILRNPPGSSAHFTFVPVSQND